MAAILTKRGQNILTNQKEWFAASLAEMNTIDKDSISPGDYSYIYSGDNRGELYFVNENKEWVKQ